MKKLFETAHKEIIASYTQAPTSYDYPSAPKKTTKFKLTKNDDDLVYTCNEYSMFLFS